MLILTIRTDGPGAEVALYVGQKQLASDTWESKRELASTLHHNIDELLKGQGKQLEDVEGIVAYRGPGSFTGLRIGLAVADGFAYGLTVPIVGMMGDDWQQAGVQRLLNGENDKIAIPEYGRGAHITQQRR